MSESMSLEQWESASTLTYENLYRLLGQYFTGHGGVMAADDAFSLVCQILENPDIVQDTLAEELFAVLGYEYCDLVFGIVSKSEILRQPEAAVKQPQPSRRGKKKKKRRVEGGGRPVWRKHDDEDGIYEEQEKVWEGATVESEKTYVSFTFPGPPKSVYAEQMKSKDGLVCIARDMPQWTHKAFKYEYLNPVQSKVFEVAFKTNENLLVAAPTGAGKTLIMLLCILRAMKMGRDEATGKFDLDHIKIVCIAPLKALAGEQVKEMQNVLRRYGMKLCEATGDTDNSAEELRNANVIVATPEKWDVITRKSSNAEFLVKVSLMIIDEVHLLQDNSRGEVIEMLVSRTIRFAELKQRSSRIVALSATLPNCEDVAEFLCAERGLFRFGDEYRPVPLTQTYIGVRKMDIRNMLATMDTIAYNKAVDSLQEGHQVLVFVHSRKGTVKTGEAFLQLIAQHKEERLFDSFAQQADTSLQILEGEVRNLVAKGIGVHHAGLPRRHRNVLEEAFRKKRLGVLISTATLAWGVNLPSHTGMLYWECFVRVCVVIIKGTEYYNPELAKFVDVSPFDIIQMFGRAGRPQFDKDGLAILIGKESSLNRVARGCRSFSPIESSFCNSLADHVNAEVSLGTIESVASGVRWFGYSFCHVRMKKNPLKYGIEHTEVAGDPHLLSMRTRLLQDAAMRLNMSDLVRYLPKSGRMEPLELGRIAAHYYITVRDMEMILFYVKHIVGDFCTLEDMIIMVCKSKSLCDLRVRDTEEFELKQLAMECKFEVEEISGASKFKKQKKFEVSEEAGELGNGHLDDRARFGRDYPDGPKANVLLQAYLMRLKIREHTLRMEQFGVVQNVNRIIRGIVEIGVHLRRGDVCDVALKLAIMVQRAVWDEESLYFYQFCDVGGPKRMGGRKKWQFKANRPVLDKISRVIEGYSSFYSFIDAWRYLDAKKIGTQIGNQSCAKSAKMIAESFPFLDMHLRLRPVSHEVVYMTVELSPLFRWHDEIFSKNGSVRFWLWIVDERENELVFGDCISVRQRMVRDDCIPSVTVPLKVGRDGRRLKYVANVVSCDYLGATRWQEVPLDKIVFPKMMGGDEGFTEVVMKNVLSVNALLKKDYVDLYQPKVSFFSTIQSQVFHALYHTDDNVLLGAPTGSGKTICAEFAILRLLSKLRLLKSRRKKVVVYIAPLKTLIRERYHDWKEKFLPLGIRCTMLTGDFSPSRRELMRQDIILTTPEKWDGISRSWKKKEFVQSCGLMIIDEVHLLGTNRGHVLESIISRLRYIRADLGREAVRIVALTTALANAMDVGQWLGVYKYNIFNFSGKLRPVPIKIRFRGFPEKHFCPLMSSMNKPLLAYINEYATAKPVLIFVPSRRQTRITAMELASLCVMDGDAHRFLMFEEWVSKQRQEPSVEEGSFLYDTVQVLHEVSTEMALENIVGRLESEDVRNCVRLGIGIHHAGLSYHDRHVVEELFTSGIVQVLVATATLAWGVNLPAYMTIIKGTQVYDRKAGGYIDMSLTDILQMIGRAGRPQFEREARSLVLCREHRRGFLEHFRDISFPVESSMHEEDNILDTVNAEVAEATIECAQDCVNYLESTFFAYRLRHNPSYYVGEDAGCQNDHTFAPKHLSRLADEAFSVLEELGMAERFNRSMTIDEIEEQGLSEAAIIAQGSCIKPTKLGKIASQFYCKCRTVAFFDECIGAWSRSGFGEKHKPNADMLRCIAQCHEFLEIPVRHNEDELNKTLVANLRLKYRVSDLELGEPWTKVVLLVRAFQKRVKMPISDYKTDLHTVMQSLPRIVHAFKCVLVLHEQEEWSEMMDDLLTLVEEYKKEKRREIH